jgi:hypothetical protein
VYVQKYSKASPFARDAVLKNPINSETVNKIKKWEKLGMGNQRHMKHGKI